MVGHHLQFAVARQQPQAVSGVRQIHRTGEGVVLGQGAGAEQAGEVSKESTHSTHPFVGFKDHLMIAIYHQGLIRNVTNIHIFPWHALRLLRSITRRIVELIRGVASQNFFSRSRYTWLFFGGIVPLSYCFQALNRWQRDMPVPRRPACSCTVRRHRLATWFAEIVMVQISNVAVTAAPHHCAAETMFA